MRNKIRVALMTYAIDGRLAKGTAIVARKSVEAFLQNRDRFDITFIHYEKTDDPIYTHGVREVLLPTIYPKFFNRRSLRQIYYFLTTKDTFDVVQWFQPRLYLFFWLVPAKQIIVTVHGAGDVAEAKEFNFTREVFNWTLKLFKRKVTIAIAGSDYAEKDIIKRYGFDPKQLRIVHNGVDTHFTQVGDDAVIAVKKKYRLPKEFFLNVARLNPSKNAFRTLRAFDTFATLHPECDIHFVNIGAQGSDKPFVDDFLKRSSFKERIHLVNYIEAEDLPAVYNAALALIFPLLNEGLGLPVLEAMACGTPVVASNTSFPEINKDDALLVDALDEQDIANAMYTMVANPSLRERLVQKGLERARLFSWEESGKKLLAIYDELSKNEQSQSADKGQ